MVINLSQLSSLWLFKYRCVQHTLKMPQSQFIGYHENSNEGMKNIIFCLCAMIGKTKQKGRHIKERYMYGIKVSNDAKIRN